MFPFPNPIQSRLVPTTQVRALAKQYKIKGHTTKSEYELRQALYDIWIKHTYVLEHHVRCTYCNKALPDLMAHQQWRDHNVENLLFGHRACRECHVKAMKQNKSPYSTAHSSYLSSLGRSRCYAADRAVRNGDIKFLSKTITYTK